MPRDRRRKPGKWSYTAGVYGRTVRVYERTSGGIIYAATADGQGGEVRRSLGHRDREKAEEYADDEAAKLRDGLNALTAGRPTLRRIFTLYEAERTPDKASSTQAEDRRRMVMFRRLWGDGFDLRALDRVRWERFIRERRIGAIDARGEPVGDEERCPVGNRTIECDLKFLRAVCRWATNARDTDGQLLLDTDPTRGLDVPKEKNPQRPVATHDRVDAIRAVYHDVRVEIGWEGPPGERRRVTARSYLPEIFEIVVGTGRRIGAVCALRLEDIDLDRTSRTPYGAITWPEDTDKQGRRWRCPVSKSVHDALESTIRRRPRVGPGPLFVSPKDHSKPVRYELASDWLREAERLAKLEPQKGTLWHAYRRLWASARKDLPDVDVAQAGGWASLAALRLAYQQPDDATLLRVVEHDTELREVR